MQFNAGLSKNNLLLILLGHQHSFKYREDITEKTILIYL